MTMTIEREQGTDASVPAMRITAERADLAAAVTWAARGVAKRPVVPVLAGMRLEVAGGRLELAGFDYELTSIARVAGDGARSGAVLVNGAQLAAAVRSLPKVKGAQPVTLASDGNVLTVECGGITSRVPLLDLGEYPSLPALPALAGMADAGILAAAIGRAGLAAGRDDTLPSLTCVRFAFSAGEVTLQATDRYRAHEESVPWVADGNPDPVLIPNSALAVAVKAMAKHGVISLHAGDGFAALVTDSRTMITRSADGNLFPKLANLWPAEVTDRIAVDGALLAGAVKRAGTHLERNGGVVLECGPDFITVTASQDGAEAYRESVPASGVAGCVIAVQFNPAYLAAAVSATGGVVTLGLTEPAKRDIGFGRTGWSHKPAMVTPEAGTFRAIVMQFTRDELAASYRTSLA